MMDNPSLPWKFSKTLFFQRPLPRSARVLLTARVIASIESVGGAARFDRLPVIGEDHHILGHFRPDTAHDI
ncbi:MAG: hypothetical protein HKO04_09885 [Silicimonas sp.]|nr:hypothetical protein [Silicimonas sp.]